MRRCAASEGRSQSSTGQTVARIDRQLPFIHGKDRTLVLCHEMMGCCATLLNFHASTQIHWHTDTHVRTHHV